VRGREREGGVGGITVYVFHTDHYSYLRINQLHPGMGISCHRGRGMCDVQTCLYVYLHTCDPHNCSMWMVLEL